MKALIFLMTETLQDIEASQERLKHLLDPPGRSAQWPIYVNSREDYDKLPLGTWVMDTNGYVVQRGVPIPTVVTKEDYNAVPLDATYRWQGQFYLKGTSPWQGPVDTTPSPTPWQSPPPAVVSTHSSGSTDYTPGPQHPMSGGLFVLLAILVGLFVFLRSIRRIVERKQLFEVTPTLSNLKIHEELLGQLIKLGQNLETRIEDVDDEDLAEFGVGKVNLSAYVRELQDTFSMWHGPEPDPFRTAELEKTIFGAASS